MFLIQKLRISVQVQFANQPLALHDGRVSAIERISLCRVSDKGGLVTVDHHVRSGKQCVLSIHLDLEVFIHMVKQNRFNDRTYLLIFSVSKLRFKQFYFTSLS
jgi:hypothetical protein